MNETRRRWSLTGPGLVITAAFIGPGTVTTASKAGASYGYQLLWVLVLATAATMILQNLAAKIGLATGSGLGQAIRETLPWKWSRWAVAVLAGVTIGLGNSAFQAGNLTGARMGLEIMSGTRSTTWVPVVAVMASGVLWLASHRRIERVLMAMVVAMSLGFLMVAYLVRPAPQVLAEGLMPRLPAGSVFTALALLGTTIVPYNLFLHAGLVRSRWAGDDHLQNALRAARVDTGLSVALGGLVSMAIMVSAAVAFSGSGQTLTGLGDLAQQLEPLLGQQAARFLFGLGLFAAGLTSAITAPMAAAIAIGGVCGCSESLTSPWLRLVWGAVMAVGIVVAWQWNQSPLQVIVAAQAANAILLPVLVGLLIAVSNFHGRMQQCRPSIWENGAVGIVMGLVLLLSGQALYRVFTS